MPRKEKMSKKDKDELDIAEGIEDEEVYRKTGREKLLEDDELSPDEEGFMEGEDQEGEGAKCAFCGAALVDAEDIVEEEIDDRNYMFCSARHAEFFVKKKKGKSQLED